MEPSDKPDFRASVVIPICLAIAFKVGPKPLSIIEFHVSASILPLENA